MITRRWWLVLLVCLTAGGAMAIAVAAHRRSAPADILISVDHSTLPANGYSEAHLKLTTSNGRDVPVILWRFAKGKGFADLQMTPADFKLRAGVTPGGVELVASAPGFKAGHVDVTLGLDPTDQFGDGTPDFLRLQDQTDRNAFRDWFTYLAEATYVEKPEDRPTEVSDCAALIRFAYREALRKHDGEWAKQWHLSPGLSLPSIKKYEYPHTALAAGLLRIRPNAFSPEDINNGAFAEFADAESLRRFNTHLISRDLRAARPGDLLFFRQSGAHMPFHTMIFLGRSHFGEGDNGLIYHTGPDGKKSGEIRRVSVEDLMHHPEVRWRPVPQNPAFMGVYRWNILREAD